MKRIITQLTFFPLLLSCFAGNENHITGARSAGMGNASVTLPDIWSTYHNQAGLAWMEHFTGGIYYNSMFSIPELSTKYIALALPTAHGTFGLSTNYFGYTAYNEMKTGLAFGKSFGPIFAAGVQLNYQRMHFQEEIYGSSNTVTIEGGVLAKITDEIVLGSHIFNPTNAKLADYDDERIPTIIRIGAAYIFSTKVIWCIEAEKNIDFEPVFKTGVEYHPVDMFYLRGGLRTNPTTHSFGLGFNYKSFQIDIAAARHYVLGFTPHVSVLYTVNKK